jgi:hypothetical protein
MADKPHEDVKKKRLWLDLNRDLTMFPDAADSLARFSSNEKLPERTLFTSVIALYELNLRKCD